jgi:Zn-dependent M28 family amino/carboxypeptidase
VDTVLGGIGALTRIGPRDAASSTHDEAAAYVAARLRAAGYRVTLQQFRVPAGVSWGVPVPAGTAVNVVADPPGFDPTRPHLVVGAHLDTVPQSPGAEVNASGLMVLAEVARMARQQPVALPVRFVAFGAEESRGGNGTRYAFGSRHHVSVLGAAERSATRGMVALDRVGVRAPRVPVCSGGRGSPALAQAIRRAAGPVRTRSCTNRASDHVSFEAVGIPAARLGSVPYAAYHSSRDVPSVVDRGQLQRTGAVLWSWLQSARP